MTKKTGTIKRCDPILMISKDGKKFNRRNAWEIEIRIGDETKLFHFPDFASSPASIQEASWETAERLRKEIPGIKTLKFSDDYKPLTSLGDICEYFKKLS